MKNIRDTYRRRMIGQLQLWEEHNAAIKNEIGGLDPIRRMDAIKRYQELEHRYREVFTRFEDLLLASEDNWEKLRIALDDVVVSYLQVLDTFTMQPA